MEKFVSGIGGVFFRSKDNKALALWYEKNFRINTVSSNIPWSQEAGPTVFSPFKEDTGYFGSKNQQFMINFRVHNLDKFVEELKLNGVKIDSERMEESYGKFAWVYDPEGNKIELWEPKE
ncbi:VOC family protein [Aurantibacillus circumpalustris]|uniref:VOC family protein n=1 Tax=Aurantibacillus circumpalustris TaxID=3036359 RepID=UPI00295C2560|nr:VOC family protein [Aurantibacillus circumpalustris]